MVAVGGVAQERLRPEAVTVRPRPEGPSPVQAALYEDALRREAERREEPVVVKATRGHDPEA